MCCRNLIAAAMLSWFLVPAQAMACTVSAGPLNFGAYNFHDAAPLDTVTSLQINCPVGTPFQIALERQGTAPLRMQPLASGPPLKFNLYVDAARSRMWGNGNGGTQVRTGTGTGTAAGVTVYGRIPAGQAVAAGIYTSQVTVTVVW